MRSGCWIRSRYDDGGYSGGSTDRPDLQRLLDDIRARKIDVIVVYKVDRLTRSLADFISLPAWAQNVVSESTDKGRVYRIKDSRASSGAADRVKQVA
jgi:hypothetical protein